MIISTWDEGLLYDLQWSKLGSIIKAKLQHNIKMSTRPSQHVQDLAVMQEIYCQVHISIALELLER